MMCCSQFAQLCALPPCPPIKHRVADTRRSAPQQMPPPGRAPHRHGPGCGGCMPVAQAGGAADSRRWALQVEQLSVFVEQCVSASRAKRWSRFARFGIGATMFGDTLLCKGIAPSCRLGCGAVSGATMFGDTLLCKGIAPSCRLWAVVQSVSCHRSGARLVLAVHLAQLEGSIVVRVAQAMR